MIEVVILPVPSLGQGVIIGILFNHPGIQPGQQFRQQESDGGFSAPEPPAMPTTHSALLLSVKEFTGDMTLQIMRAKRLGEKRG